jgi:translation initiation factor IF-2
MAKNKDVEKRIATLSITGKGNSKQEKVKIENSTVSYIGSLTVGELATALNIRSSDIIKKYFLKGLMLTINSPLNDELIGEICIDHGYDFSKEKENNVFSFEDLEVVDDPSSLEERPPVVTVMGHVDHGKTTLIDAIRSSRVAEGEVGGISQEIGAYQKTCKGKKITFIDTPGHEAFTAMRSRGASVTDIVILVVAADDGVMPQTIEAIDHAKAAGVPIIVAINKMDVPGANPDRVISELVEQNIIPEVYGGDVIVCKISAKKKQGIDELLESVLLQAEMSELKANANRYAIGTVLEAKLDKREGPKATLLVQNGSLRTGDFIVVGTTFGKIRRMTNDLNQIIDNAAPATPVSVIGLDEVPLAGDKFVALDDEKLAKEISTAKKLAKEDETRKANNIASLDDLTQKVQEGQLVTVNLIIKTDSTGSAEAVKSSIEKINVQGTKINIIRATAGAITDSDILLASASNAIIYGFGVRPDANVKNKAIEEKVEIRLHRIIYALIEEIEAALKGMRKKEEVEQYLGQAEVRTTFKVSKVGTIAGSYVIDGRMTNSSRLRVLRDGKIIYEGKIGSLKRFKDDAKEVKQGYECGILVENFNDIHEGDIIEAFTFVQKED